MHVLPVSILGAVFQETFFGAPLLGKGAVPCRTSAFLSSLKFLDDRTFFDLFAFIALIGILKLIRL